MWGTGMIDTDPMFYNPPAGNLHLQPASPCINAGDPNPIYDDPDGSRNDMGAYGGPGADFDTDLDGMENWWETYWGLDPLDPSDASENPDGDAYTNLVEFINGTDPFTYTPSLFYVDADATGAETGLSWGDAFTIIRDAMVASLTGGMLWVAEGAYYRPLGGTEPVLIMKDGVEVYGGFQGWESDLSERGDPAN